MNIAAPARVAVLLAALVPLAACTVGQAVKPNPETGYIGTGDSAKMAQTVLAKPVDLTKYRKLVVVTAGDFAEEQTRNLAAFEEVIDIEELQRRIVAADLGEKVPSVSDRIGLSNAARHWQPFLWVRYDTENRGGKLYGRLVVTEAATLTDVFIAEKHLDYVWKGVNDQNTFYPMFNSLIAWLKEQES